MPNQLSAVPSSYFKLSHDPTVTINGDPLGSLGDNPYGALTDELLFGFINTFFGYVDDATGLDFLAILTPLENLLGAEHGLLSGLIGFLTPGSGTAGGGIFGPLLGLIPGLGGGAGTLGGLGDFLNPASFLGAAAGIFAPLLSGGSFLGGLIPGLDASKITSGAFSLSQLPTTVLNSITGVASSLLTGLLSLGNIPNLPAGQITSGTFLSGLIPGLDASKIISGTLGSSLLQPLIDVISTGFGGGTGLGFSGLSTLLASLVFGGLTDFEAIVSGLFGIGGGDEALFGSLGGNLMKFLGLPNLSTGSAFNPIKTAEGWLQSVLTPAGALTSLTQVPSHLYGQLNVGQNLTVPGFSDSQIKNVLPDPGCSDASFIEGGGAWLWDAKNHTGCNYVDYVAGSGSFKTVGASIVRQLLGVPVITQPGQVTDFGCWVYWESLTAGSGNAITLVASAFDANDDLIVDSARVVSGIASPGATSVGYSGTDVVGGLPLPRDTQNWVNLTGTYLAPANTSHIRITYEVTSTVSGGNIYYDDGLHSPRGHVDATLLGNLPGIPQLPSSAIAGIGGLSDIGQTVQAVLDYAWSGFRKSLGTGKSPADLASAVTATVNTAENARDTGDENSAILAIRNNTPFYSGIDETEESTFLLDSLVGATDPPNFGVTSTTTPIAFWRCGVAATKGFVTWFGKGVTSVTGIYIDLYRLSDDGVTLVYLRSSPDLSGQMGSSWTNGIWVMSGSARQDVVPGENYAFGLRVTGSGTHTVAGIAAGWMPNHALSSSMASPNKKAAVRTDGAHSNITMSGITYSGNQLWCGFGINNGDITPPVHQPRSYQYTGPQTTDFAIPDWVKFIDLVAVGAGRGGGGSLFYAPGSGGGAGSHNTATLAVGTGITGTSLHIVIGARGTGGAGTSGGAGGNGGNVTVTSTGMTTFVAAGATVNNGLFGPGADAGSLTYRDTFYQFGNGGSGGQVGSAPGGGGGGGLPYLAGKDGGNAALWIVYRAV